MAKSNEQLILEKLDQIVKVLSLQVGTDKSLTERVWLLKLAGLDNETIAQVLSLSRESVRTLLYQSKKKLG